jgi:hypothetical protein
MPLMVSRRLLSAPLLMALAAVSAVSLPAHADVTKNQCVDANSNGQALRLDGKLAAARHELQVCSDPTCPGIVRTDCTQRMEELERAQPTIIFEVKDGAGADMSAVRVTLDGKPLPDKIEGTALRIDPGEHTFTFAANGIDPVTRKFVLLEGEKGRRERVVLGSTVAQAPAQAPVLQASPPPPAEVPASGLGTQKIIGLTVGGLGIAGLAVGTIFGLMTFAAASDQNSDCSSSSDCPRRASALSDHTTGSTEGAVSTAAFIAGGALVVTGITLFFTAPSGRKEQPSTEGQPSTSLRIAPMLGHSLAGVSLQGAF